MGIQTRQFMYSRHPGSFTAGFTLIELLVVTTLSMLLLGGALAAYSSLSTRQGRLDAGNQLVADLRSTQLRSRNGDRPDGCSSLGGYQVWNTGVASNQYRIAVQCNSPNELQETLTKTLPAGEVFLSTFTLVFPPLPGSVTGAPATIDIGKSGDTLRYRFTIDAQGVISQGVLVTE